MKNVLLQMYISKLGHDEFSQEGDMSRIFVSELMRMHCIFQYNWTFTE